MNKSKLLVNFVKYKCVRM